MANYFETIYFKDEYGEKAYPQKLCTYIAQKYYSGNGKISGKKILDIGSGKGNHLVGFARLGLTAHGVDKRAEQIEALTQFEIVSCDIESEPLPYTDACFDFVFSKSVLEHVVNTDNFLQETLRVLKPGGVAVLMTPDWRSQQAFFWDDYTHVKPFTRKSLQNAMKITGFENVDCSYFLQLPSVWKYPWMKIITGIVSILPDCLKWKDKAESMPRNFIRFSKEEMLLAIGYKANV